MATIWPAERSVRVANPAESEHVRRTYSEIAARYDEYVSYTERWFLGDGRRWVCARAHGDVLEIGVGTGRNLLHYAPDTRLTGVDLTPAMLVQARDRAVELGIDAELRLGDAQALDFRDNRFDAVVMTLVLSAVPDARRAMAEARRVLRPGGRLLVLDFVRSPHRPVRVVQRLLNPLLVGRYDFHCMRDPLDHLEGVGLTIDRVERSKLGIVQRAAARNPAADNGAALSPVIGIEPVVDQPTGASPVLASLGGARVETAHVAPSQQPVDTARLRLPRFLSVRHARRATMDSGRQHRSACGSGEQVATRQP